MLNGSQNWTGWARRSWNPADAVSAPLSLFFLSDPSYLTLSGSNVSQWRDPITGKTASQGVDANRLVYQSSGGPSDKPYLSCGDGTVVRFVSFGNVFSALTSAEIFIVRRAGSDPSTGGTNRGGIWNFGSSGSTSHHPFTDSVIYDDFASTVRKTVGDPTPALTNWHIYNAISASGEWTANLNGLQIFTTATNTVGWSAVPTIGCSGGIANDGGITAVIMFGGKLSTDDRARTNRWLNLNFGLGLSL